MLRVVLIAIVVLLLIGALPHWGYAPKGGYRWYPAGGLGLLLVVLVILILLGVI